MSRVSHPIDRVEVTFDDKNLVANAGLLLVSTLVVRLGLEQLIDTTVRLGDRVGGARPGRKLLTIVQAMLIGGSHIDHAELLRAGSTQRVLSHRVMAPSTIGTFLRAFTFGHLRQLDHVIGVAITRAWAMGAGPAAGSELVIDLDSTICEVHGYQKQGAGYGYTHVLGYHPLLAVRADTGEVLLVRLRKGSANTARGANRFVEETIALVRRAGHDGPIMVRADAGFWSNKTINTCRRLGVGYSIAVRAGHSAIQSAISKIHDHAWVDIAYPSGGRAQVAEIAYKGHRLVVRRTRLAGRQAQLFDTWRHHAFLTDRAGDVVAVDAFHREHATVELAIRELKNNGAAHLPSGDFHANGAWLAAAVLGHNLLRWTARLARLQPPGTLLVARTVLVRLLAIPARLVNHSGQPRLRMPRRWPFAQVFTRALDRLRTLPPVPV